MPKKSAITVEHLWQFARVGAPSLSPDGAQAVAAVARYTMEENKASSSLWLMSTLGGKARLLTSAGDKDAAPRWSPRGDLIAFLAKREQEDSKDDTQQLYLIAPDGGEARRAAKVATGVESFRWCPDGRHIVFASWVWPEQRGHQAQAKRFKAFKERKESGYATSEAQYRYWDHQVPMGRVAHLHLLDTQTGRFRDLFEGKDIELTRTEPDAQQFDISPDGRSLVVAFDPASEKRIDGRFALAELELKSGRITTLVQDSDWDCSAPRYSPDGNSIAFTASHQGAKHTMPNQLAVLTKARGAAGADWQVLSGEWDHEVQAPLLWEDDGQAVLFTAEQQGRKHLWRFELAARRAELVVPGGWMQSFDKAAGTLVTLADTAAHPPQLRAHLPLQESRRIEDFNDALMAKLSIGHTEERWFDGASSAPSAPAKSGKAARASKAGRPDKVQMWITYPPGMDATSAGSAKKKAPLLHLIHGGPHTAFGDAWHWRWNVQAMAAQGYVVACVNYHGSSSFGHAFLDSITHRWGELELQDVEAATDLLLIEPWADPQRVFASGGSYGGFMVAWMNGHVPVGRYAAYICHAGCFDWTGMFADDAYTWHAKELGAYYWDNLAQVNAQSPHAFAAAMKTPTLVIHGALDYRVPDAQGLAYYNTLKAQSVPARLVWYPDENHWILKPRNSRQWYGEFFDWLRAWDPAAKAGKASKTKKSRSGG
jgi:dipeptidyl aminopeptidase/acylaminoacyl peptidase